MLFEESTEATAADRESLLPGEPPGPVGGQDAAHWVEVYEELIRFNQRMIELVEQRTTSLPAFHARPEEADLELLQAHLARLMWRLQAWKRLQSQLMAEAINS